MPSRNTEFRNRFCRPFLLVVIFGAFLSAPSRSARATVTDQLSPEEQSEINARLRRFYAQPISPDAMNEPTPKYGVREKHFIHPKPFLKFSDQSAPQLAASPLRRLAQRKATDSFHRAYCKRLGRKSPRLRCNQPPARSWAMVEDDDRVQDLTDSWIATDDLTFDLDEVPTSGDTELPLWSDDYWRLQWGGLSYRYAAGTEFKDYEKAIHAYAQPKEWKGIVDDLGLKELAKTIVDWSPAEKYDLSVGDERFSLTRQQKKAGRDEAGKDGDVEDWMGICDGWAQAAIMVPKPDRPVTVTGPGEVPVTWYPADIRALASLAWSNADAPANFVGGRCDNKKLVIYGNGRLAQQECFDTNPATFHLALANMIGRHHLSFVMDKAYDYEVWNQPIQGYKFTYFNPLELDKKSDDWKKVAVDYDDDFKDADRFQKPLTRGRRIGKEKWSDRGIKKIVGVIATVTYLDELSPPPHTKTPPDEEPVRETYTYDLEIYKKDGAWVPRGGEWFQNAHPDFLWVPRRGAVARTDYDKPAIDFDGSEVPSDDLASRATPASDDGYPLCNVVSYLVGESSGTDSYRCYASRHRR